MNIQNVSKMKQKLYNMPKLPIIDGFRNVKENGTF